MPHLHIEYTDNLTGLNERELMRDINAVVCSHPTVLDEADVKARIARLNMDHVYIGPAREPWLCPCAPAADGRPRHRSQEADVGRHCRSPAPPVPQPADVMVQLSVDVSDMDKATYFKGRL
jgi:5-carboxymethyl-2-hydroxymuconate isomerase